MRHDDPIEISHAGPCFELLAHGALVFDLPTLDHERNAGLEPSETEHLEQPPDESWTRAHIPDEIVYDQGPTAFRFDQEGNFPGAGSRDGHQLHARVPEVGAG